MNRTKLIIFALVMLFYAGSAFSQVAILLDDEEIPLDILFKNDEDILFIPLKTLCNRLSATYKYNPETKIILLAKDRDTIKLQIDNTLVIVNDEWKYLKSPVQRVGEEIIVPFEAVAGFLGSAVSFRTGVPEPPAPADAPAEHAPMHDHASMSEPVQAQPPKAEPPARAEVYAPDRPAPEFFAPSEKSI
ncbi:MAG: copper amine oxidase N-terminal domain-containing protein, partial [bacterium]|nr:copper amine oxidase N-terminal domain-containing protein [bacterium]